MQALPLAAALCAVLPNNAFAQVYFGGKEYGSMGEALTAVNGEFDPEWFTPERRDALGDILSDIAARIVGNLGNAMVASKAPGGKIGQDVTKSILNDRIEWLTRTAIEYARTRPDNRPKLEQLMEKAGVSYLDVDPEPYLYRGAQGFFEYERAFLQHVQNQLTLQAASKGRSSIPDAWLGNEIWKLESALRDLRALAQEAVPDSAEDDAGFCLTTEGELFDYFVERSGGGIMFANNSVIAVANAPTTTQVVAGASGVQYDYRVEDLELCGALERWRADSAADLNGDVQGRISDAVSYACTGEGGEFSESSIYIRDLDGDGAQDLILDHGGLNCSGGMSVTCGVQVCTSEIYLQRDGSLQKVIEILNRITSISADAVPLIGVWGHGGTQGEIRWNGQAFALQ